MVGEDCTEFDPIIIMHINSVFSALTQMGVGPAEGFMIIGEDDLWSDYLQDNIKMEMVKSYVYLKTRLLFDPPDRAAVMDATNSMIAEYEFRLSVAVDPPQNTDTE